MHRGWNGDEEKKGIDAPDQYKYIHSQNPL